MATKSVDTYVALLRGINVGGKNLIKMTALKECFEAQGFEGVRTYIQSGNVVFSAPKEDHRKLTRLLDDALSDSFGYTSRVVVRSVEEMRAIVDDAPRGFGRKPDIYRYDVIFLRDELTPTKAMEVVSTKEGVDQVWAGKGVLYFSRLISKATASRLNRIVGTPAYKDMTIRNWDTTTKLLALMETSTDAPKT